MTFTSPKYLFILLVSVMSSLSFSQETKLQIKGEQFLKKEKYTEAIQYFSSIDSLEAAQDPLYHYYYGMSYYYSLNQK